MEISMLTLVWCLLHSCSTAVANKRAQSFCQKSWWLVTDKHTYTFHPAKLKQAMLSRHSMETYQGNKLTRNLSGNALLQSSQLTKLLWTDLGLKVELVQPSSPPLKQTMKKKPTHTKVGNDL